MQQNINYTNRIVAFIDILGFANIVKSLPQNPSLFNKLNYALNQIKSVQTNNAATDTQVQQLEVSVFSDSIAISTSAVPPMAEQNFNALVWTIGWLQANLMYVGIFVRGGVATGQTIHENGILYGEGMISAYKLESKSAIYPRIIISKNVIGYNNPGITPYISLDFDHFNYINPFKFEAVPENADQMAANGYDPRSDYFTVVGKHIFDNMTKTTEENHLAKYRWLGEKFNNEISIFNQMNTNQNAPKLAPLLLHNNNSIA